MVLRRIMVVRQNSASTYLDHKLARPVDQTALDTSLVDLADQVAAEPFVHIVLDSTRRLAAADL